MIAVLTKKKKGIDISVKRGVNSPRVTVTKGDLYRLSMMEESK